MIELDGELGKLSAAQVRGAAASWAGDGNRDHMAQPGMAYLSQPTEYGMLYSRSELEEMRGVCEPHWASERQESAGSKKDKPTKPASERIDEASPGSSCPGLADLC